MKKLSLLLVFIISIQVLVAQLPTDGLIAYYPFSISPEDVVGFNDGIITGNVTPTEDRGGNTGCAYNFDGEMTSTIFMQGADFSIPSDSSLSISLWYQGGSIEADPLLIEEIQVFSILGELVISQPITKNQEVIPIDQLEAGSYIVSALQVGVSVFNETIIKQ